METTVCLVGDDTIAYQYIIHNCLVRIKMGKGFFYFVLILMKCQRGCPFTLNNLSLSAIDEYYLTVFILRTLETQLNCSISQY